MSMVVGDDHNLLGYYVRHAVGREWERKFIHGKFTGIIRKDIAI